ncbi:MAG: DUF2309 family protein [Leptospiraceae bacterium]|nr:DUF2309 family protein [Leptospiraceae bacterium]MCP5513131.1 DUF2309 family protein [Leptospiraceae bacterium]
MNKNLLERANMEEIVKDTGISETEVIAILERVSPLWDLESYIAVNPFLGYTDKPFEVAMPYLEKLMGTELVPDIELLENGKISKLKKKSSNPTYRLESLLGGFLTSYSDRGTSFWSNPWKNLPIWEAFRNWAQKDPIFRGLLDVESKNALKSLPVDALGSIVKLTQSSKKLNHQVLEYLLFLMPGWSGYFRKQVWLEKIEENSSLTGYLAILCFLYEYNPDVFPDLESKSVSEIESRLSALKQKEKEYRSELIAKILGNQKLKTSSDEGTKARVRFLFCIDVRSESMRRHLENSSLEIETEGFAGFFGMPIGYKYWTGEEFSHSPALIKPSYVFKDKDLNSQKLFWETKSWIQKIKRTFPIGFQYVEGAGFLSGLGLVSKTLRQNENKGQFRKLSNGDIKNSVLSLPPETRNAIALGVLKHLGWTDNFPEYIVITGHGSHTENNPHEAGLACGACSGQSGELSARFACELFNLEEVRLYLQSENIVIPDSCKFIPALHETVTDEIILFDEKNIEPGFLPVLKKWMETAKESNRLEKKLIMGLNPKSAEVRSKDWAEVFPEAGLAGCAAFIIGRREITKGLNLEGRSFLNSYDYKKDPELKTLELLLTAPMVVTSWINLQYYASTVAPEKFGAGNKLIHSITGNLGVLEGNSWNLKSGLPLQSVFNGEKFIHQPIRLQVVVESPIQNINKILSKHKNVANLVDGEWIQMIVLDPEKGVWMRKDEEWSSL